MIPGADSDPHPRLLAVAPASAAFAALADELLRAGHRLRFRADGGSMQPFLRAGDVLTVHPLGATPVRRGDVILYRLPGAGVVAHRVVGRPAADGERLIPMRGDASCRPPDLIRAGDILGRVVSRQRGRHTRVLDAPVWRALGLLWALRQTLRQHWRRGHARMNAASAATARSSGEKAKR